jgi:hypothetical protein
MQHLTVVQLTAFAAPSALLFLFRAASYVTRRAMQRASASGWPPSLNNVKRIAVIGAGHLEQAMIRRWIDQAKGLLAHCQDARQPSEIPLPSSTARARKASGQADRPPTHRSATVPGYFRHHVFCV